MALPDSDYNDALLNATGQRNWLFLGLVLSLALHLLLCLYLYQTRFAPADLALAPRVDPAPATSMLNEIERSTAQELSKNPNATHEQSLLNDSAVSGRPQPALSGTELATSTNIKRPNTFTSKIQADSAGPNKNRVA